MESFTHLLKKIKSLRLQAQDYAIFGSGPMLIRGLKETQHDIDIIARGSAWDKYATLGKVETAPLGDKRVRLFNGQVEVFNGWKPGNMDADDLIDNAEIIDGLPFVHIEHVLEYKKALNRKKDREDIKKIEQYLQKDSSVPANKKEHRNR